MRSRSAIGLTWVLLLVLGAGGCSLDWKAANRVHVGQTGRLRLIELMGEPDEVVRTVGEDTYVYTDALPGWPLVLPWVAIVYGIIYYNWDANTFFAVLRDGIVVNKYARGPDAHRLDLKRREQQ